MGCEKRWSELHNMERALEALRREALGPGTLPYNSLYKELGAMKAKMGLKAPSLQKMLGMVKGLSPGEFEVVFDSVHGNLVRGRADAWSPWVEHWVDDTLAARVLARRISPKEERFLLTPSTYVGE